MDNIYLFGLVERDLEACLRRCGPSWRRLETLGRRPGSDLRVLEAPTCLLGMFRAILEAFLGILIPSAKISPTKAKDRKPIEKRSKNHNFETLEPGLKAFVGRIGPSWKRLRLVGGVFEAIVSVL